MGEGILKGYETFWGGGNVDPNLLSVAVPLANAQGMSDFLATLQPKTDAQKQALARASQYASMGEQSRLLMSLQVASPPVSWVLVERAMQRFRSMRTLQKFSSVHAQVHNHSIRSAISSPARFTNKGAPPRWPSGAPSRQSSLGSARAAPNADDLPLL